MRWIEIDNPRRESKCPFKAFPAREAYLRGYITGKSLSTLETAQIISFPAKDKKDV